MSCLQITAFLPAITVNKVSCSPPSLRVCLFGGKGKPGDIIEVQFLGSSLKALSQKEVHYGAYATSDQETDQLMALRNTYLNAIIRSYLNVRKKIVLQRAADWKKIKD
ncbi:unnamed protein product [Rhodiola kirilowii]